MAVLGSFAIGQVLTAAELNAIHAAWTSHTPQIDQGASTNITKTVTYSKCTLTNKTCTWVFWLSLTASGTAGSPVTLTIPGTAASTNGLVGVGSVFDLSTTTRYVAQLTGTSTTKISFGVDVAAGTYWGETPNLALASGDVLTGSITFEVA